MIADHCAPAVPDNGAIGALPSTWRRGGVGYVGLTPSGIDVADIKRTESIVWEQVTAVDDHSDAKKTRKGIVLRLADGTEKTIDGADFYVPDGVGLYRMVRHYWRHVDDRRDSPTTGRYSDSATAGSISASPRATPFGGGSRGSRRAQCGVG
jgi:hypothetical protein